jgi:hypothetical protein
VIRKMNCQSCGMPMDQPVDHGGGRLDNPYCKYCTDAQGNLLPRGTVRQNMIQFYIQKMGKTPDEAVIEVDKIMATMPAWGGMPTAPLEPSPPAGEPPVPPTPEPTTPTESVEPTTETPTGPTTETPTEPVQPDEETPTGQG